MAIEIKITCSLIHHFLTSVIFKIQLLLVILELIKKIIEEQDIVALYTYDGFNKSLGIMQEYSNGILYSELKKFILQNSEMLKKFTTKNLYTLLASTYDESEKQIINEQIAERLEKEDFFCEDIDSEVFLHPIHTYDSYGKIDKDVRNKKVLAKLK